MKDEQAIRSGIRELVRRVRGIESQLLLRVLVIVLLMWGFNELVESLENGPAGIDTVVTDWLFDGESSFPLGSNALADVARDITALGSAVILTVLVITLSAYLYGVHDRGGAVFLLVVVVGAALLSVVLKVLIARERPDFATPYVYETSASFPSGHSQIAASLYPALAIVFARRERRKSIRAVFLVAALLIVLLVGLSRVLLAAHYPTDVMAGWAVGLSWVTLCRIGLSYVEHSER